MSSPPASPSQPTRPSPHDAVAAAAVARTVRPLTEDELDEVRWEKERDQRQRFRRLVDPAIIRNNNETTSDACIKCLVTICQNILDHPDDEKYRRFKTNNSRIKSEIVQVKGGLEFATALGFRETVENFAPVYTWKPTAQNVTDLRIGTFALKEFQQKIIAKEELAKSRKTTTVADEAAQAAQRVKLAFDDDRKAMALKTKMERERRQALLEVEERKKEADLAAPSPTRHDKDV